MATGDLVDVAVTTDGVKATLTLTGLGVNLASATERAARPSTVVLAVPDSSISPRGALTLEAE